MNNRGGGGNRLFASRLKRRTESSGSFKGGESEKSFSLERENINSDLKNTVRNKLPPLRINANDIASRRTRWDYDDGFPYMLRDRK